MTVSKERLLELTALYLTKDQTQMVEIALDNGNFPVAIASVAGAISGLRKANKISDALVLSIAEELKYPIPIRTATHQGSSKLN